MNYFRFTLAALEEEGFRRDTPNGKTTFDCPDVDAIDYYSNRLSTCMRESGGKSTRALCTSGALIQLSHSFYNKQL